MIRHLRALAAGICNPEALDGRRPCPGPMVRFAMLLERGRPQYFSKRTRLASAGFFSCGPRADDAPRQATTSGDNDFTLAVEEVSERYARTGHPRTIRTLQRYCASGHLDAQKIATTLGDKYLITPQSVARHIAQIEELRALETVATDRDQPRPVATPLAPQEPTQITEPKVTTPNDMSRPTATTTNDMSRYVERLEREVEKAQDERDFLREQINRKDRTIESLIESDRETNILVRGLQEMLGPLLGPARRDPPHEHQNS